MKGNKYGFRRILAIVLSAILVASSPGTLAFAGEVIPEIVEQSADEGKQADMPADGADEGEQADMPADGADEGEQADKPADGVDEGEQADKPADGADEGEQADQSAADRIVDPAEQSVEREAAEQSVEREAAEQSTEVQAEDPAGEEAVGVVTVKTWFGLYRAVGDSRNNNKTVRLGGNITWDKDQGCGAIMIPSDQTVVIDLAGSTLDRGLSESGAQKDGYVIRNEGTLGLVDSRSGGRITGGNNAGDGGGIYNAGTLTLSDDAAITENTCEGNGGGIYNAGTLTLSGDTAVTGNTCEGYGGGIYNTETLTFYDDAAVTGNACEGYGGGIYNTGTLTFYDDAAVTGNTGVGYGGGIYNEEGLVTINDNASVANNRLNPKNHYKEENPKLWASGGGIFNIDSELNLYGGSVTGNVCVESQGNDFGGGICSIESTTDIKGSPKVSGNSANGRADDYYCEESGSIRLVGMLTDGAKIGVRGDNTYTITTDYSKYNANDDPADFFFPNHDGVIVRLVNGEAGIITTPVLTKYIEYDENLKKEERTQENVKALPQSNTGSIPGDWYAVNKNMTIRSRLCFTGDTNLILCDGCTLNVKGLYIPAGSTLTIYAQSDGENAGKLISYPDGGAGIGGYSEHDNGKIVIHGGNITATGYDHCAGIGSNDGRSGGDITIYGGTITAKGGSDGAGIGGGRYCSGGTITIYGGDITANGPTDSDCCENGAGIGGGYQGAGGDITIYGGSITTYSRDGAGIGGGDEGAGGNITIHGGTITSTKVNQGQGARIGGGCDADGGTVTIDGGTITVTGGSGAGIGGGKGCTGGTVTINGGTITATGGSGAGIGSGADGKSSTITIKGGDIFATAVNKSAFGIGNGINTPESANCTIHLGYDDDTKERIRITASFGGKVTLDNPFRSNNHVFLEGVVSDNEFLNDGLLVAWDPTKMTWAELQLMINDAADEETVKLYAHVRATENDKCLTVPDGKNIVLDLNGRVLDRNLINDYEYNGCAIEVESGATLTIRDTDQYASGYITGGRNTENGGAIYNEGTLAIKSGSIKNCKAQKSGGGIYNQGTLTIEGGTIENCEANGNGGAIYNEGTSTIEGGTITGCHSYKDGGGIYNEGKLTIEEGTIESCDTKTGGGGGIYNGRTLTITGGTISSCDASSNTTEGMAGFGGGIYNAENCVLTIKDGTIKNNTSRGGGGIYNDGGGSENNNSELVITGGTISGNKTTLAGGGIYLSYGTADISGGSITGNKTDGSGGGIYVNGGALTLSGGSITENDAQESGGGICVIAWYPTEAPKLKIKGHPEVTGNTRNGSVNNIDMDSSQRIEVIDTLDQDVVLGVTLRNSSGTCSGTITTGLKGNGKVTNFKSDDYKYVVKLNADGEAILVSRLVIVKGVTGSFKDKIKLNYYFEFPEFVLADEGAYVTITKKGDNNTDKPNKLFINEDKYVEGKGYMFSIPLVAKEASDTIIARVFDSQGNPLPIQGDLRKADYTETGVEYSLMQYFDWLSADNSNTTDKEKAIGAAARDYCTAAQLYFNYHVTEGMSVSDAVTNMEEDAWEKLLDCIAERSDGAPPAGVSVKGISAMLESDNTLRMYYAFDDDAGPDDYYFYIDGFIVDDLKYRKDGMGYLALDKGVNSNHLQDKHSYEVWDGNNSYTITASVLTYARSCALQSNPKVSNLGKALFLYNQAAVEAFGE